MLQLSGVTVNYGPIEAVHELDLTVSTGQLVAVLGANGAGKSSTLRAIAGVVRPSSGRIDLAGERVDGMSPERIARSGVSLVPEGRGILTTLSVHDNLRLAAVGGGTTAQFQERCQQLFETFPVLRTRLSSLAGLLSGGEQQQLALGRAIIRDPKLLLLDEPSLGLAPMLRDSVFEQIVRLRQDGMTVVLVEQDARRALRIADWAVVLSSGHKVLDLPAGEALTSFRELEAAYMGERRER